MTTGKGNAGGEGTENIIMSVSAEFKGRCNEDCSFWMGLCVVGGLGQRTGGGMVVREGFYLPVGIYSVIAQT